MAVLPVGLPPLDLPPPIISTPPTTLPSTAIASPSDSPWRPRSFRLPYLVQLNEALLVVEPHKSRASVNIRHQVAVAPRTVVGDDEHVTAPRAEFPGPHVVEGQLLVRVDDDRQPREVFVDPEEFSALLSLFMDRAWRSRRDEAVKEATTEGQTTENGAVRTIICLGGEVCPRSSSCGYMHVRMSVLGSAHN